jgi:hypothetical protein
MIKAANEMRNIYTGFFHVTCTAHLIHNCAMRIKSKFLNIDNVIARVTALTNKNKVHAALFNEMVLPHQ